MSERPRVLDDLGVELDRVGRRNLAASGGLRPAPRRLSAATVLIAGLLLLGAAAAAAALLINQGAPLPAPHAQDLRSSGVPIPGSARLAGLDAPDPDPEAPPWDIRLSRTRAGETCTAVGQVVDGKFGIVGLDHTFRALPLGGVDACGVASPDGPMLAGARVFVGSSPQEARTIVNGVAGEGARSVTAFGPEGSRVLRLGPGGSFITVYRGYVEEVRPRVVVVGSDGRSHTISFAQSSAFEVADPGGGSPWEISGGEDGQPGALPDENCAQATQEVGRTDPSRSEAPLTPLVCGRLGQQPLFALMRRFVPGSGENTSYPWGNNPTRTLVYGAVTPRVRSLTLTGAGTAKTLEIDPHGGVFLAVLDGHIDPDALTLTARLRDGQTLTYTRSANLLDTHDRPLPEPPVPAYRNPLAPKQAEPPPPDIPILDTVRETLRASDPAGGPQWVLRSWQGRINPRAKFGPGYQSKRFLCTQSGVIEHHRLFQPRPGSTPLPLSLGENYGLGIGGCDAPSDLVRYGPLAQSASYVDDPYAYAPQPLRIVVSGLLPVGARNPLLVGAGAPRPLAVDSNHAFLAVLPGRYWDAPLRISVTLGRRTIVRSAVEGPGGAAPTVPQARAPDPDGGAPWGFAATANSSAYGRIVDGRFATIEGSTGALHNGPNGWSEGGTSERLPHKDQPVRFEVHGGPEGGQRWESQATLSRPAIERRTLPGRTIITGIADAEVVSVTLQTPRDVRTLRPSGSEHVLIAVYDGQFFRGEITATVQLHGGRTVTQRVPNGPGGILTLAKPPTLQQQLRRDRTTLAGMQSHVARAEHANGTQREKILGGAPFSQILKGLAGIRRIVKAEEARLAYERAHPGVLPAE